MVNLAIKKISRILVPEIGEFVADSAIKVNCERLGIKPEELTSSRFPEFIEKVKITLLLFLEEKEIEEVVQKIKNLK